MAPNGVRATGWPLGAKFEALLATMNLNISFSPDGIAQYLWTDALPLHELSRLGIHRATNIEFNNATQHWEAKDRIVL